MQRQTTVGKQLLLFAFAWQIEITNFYFQYATCHGELDAAINHIINKKIVMYVASNMRRKNTLYLGMVV